MTSTKNFSVHKKKSIGMCGVFVLLLSKRGSSSIVTEGGMIFRVVNFYCFEAKQEIIGLQKLKINIVIRNCSTLLI